MLPVLAERAVEEVKTSAARELADMLKAVCATLFLPKHAHWVSRGSA